MVLGFHPKMTLAYNLIGEIAFMIELAMVPRTELRQRQRDMGLPNPELWNQNSPGPLLEAAELKSGELCSKLNQHAHEVPAWVGLCKEIPSASACP